MAAKVRAACATADSAGCEVVIASWRDAEAAIAGERAVKWTVVRPSSEKVR
jgi:carbamate kinase